MIQEVLILLTFLELLIKQAIGSSLRFTSVIISFTSVNEESGIWINVGWMSNWMNECRRVITI